MTFPMMIKVVLLSLLVLSNGADLYDRIKGECSLTDYQNTCLKCLASDPNSIYADHVGFVQIVIHCLESQLQNLTNNVTSISSRKNESVAIKKVLGDCNRGFSIAKSQLYEIKHSVIIRSYKKASGLVNTTLSYPLTCRDNLQKLNFKESPEVYDDISVYAQLSSVARTMIKRLEHFI
ncbi:hypothetical protein EUTSA_v10026370mg [Eutrema salsugineum]|uniref:Pectinesterase inhibitor domain-containing protein n=1 Tax=Eutrema salsugineum TaxID=72664 RepID=V4MH62_EUTSA|nr:uncharacterized protein LOC18028437 [Eutrema salsugineum]ESQ55909.1 hypothetical protein EUTSA_v10026370mg [Eutrema salsugineum]